MSLILPARRALLGARPLAPVNNIAPALSGSTALGGQLSCTSGGWSNSPSGYSYQWYWADTGAPISAATAPAYKPVPGDVGHTIDCRVTAANAAGSATAASNTSAAITDFTASNFLGENFDGVTAPAIPATISVDSGMDTSTAFANSNPNSLRLTGTTTAKWFETASAVGDAGGNDQLTFYARLSSGTGLEVVEASLAHSGTILGGAGGSGAYYGTLLQFGTGTASAIYKWTAGAPVAVSYPLDYYELGTLLPATLDFHSILAGAITYKFVMRRAFDRNGNGWLATRIQRLSDSEWLQGWATGTLGFDTGQCEAFRAQDNSIAAASRKAGGTLQVSNTGHSAYADDFNLDRIPPIGWHAYGDSNTNGTGADTPWVVALNSSLFPYGVTVWNHGWSGYQTADIAAVIYSQPNPSHPSIIVAGTNDQPSYGYGTDATKRGFAKSALMAAICRCGLTSVQKAQGLTQGGTWLTADASTHTYDGLTSVYSNTIGSTLTGTTHGDVLYVGYSGMTDTYTGTFKVTVDGVDVATGTSAAAGIKCIALTNREYYCPQLLRIAGLGAGAHTVVITTTNGGSGGTYSFLDWIAGTGDQSSFNTVLVGNVTHMAAAGYTAFGVNDANVDAYNSDWAAAVAALAGDGLDVHLVDLAGGYNTATMIQGGTPIHHNDTGHAYLAGKFFGAITA